MHYPNIKITLFKWISYRYDREMANKLLSWNKNFFTTTVFFLLVLQWLHRPQQTSVSERNGTAGCVELF